MLGKIEGGENDGVWDPAPPRAAATAQGHEEAVGALIRRDFRSLLLFLALVLLNLILIWNGFVVGGWHSGSGSGGDEIEGDAGGEV